MQLPVPKISDQVQKQAYEDLLRGAMRQFGDAVTVLARRVLAGQFKTEEELALDWQVGEEASLNRRMLAAEALDRVPLPRRIFPAPPLAGLIFRGSEFELPGTMSWSLWSQLLSRACDRDRVGQAHPAFPGIVGALADDETKLLQVVQHGPVDWYYGDWRGNDIEENYAEWAKAFPRLAQVEHLPAYAKHVEALGLVNDIVFKQQGDADGREGWIIELALSDFGVLFAKAVLETISD